MNITNGIRQVKAGILYWLLRIALSVPISQGWALNAIKAWADYQMYGGTKGDAALRLQKQYAKMTGGSLCDYCTWTIKKGDTHNWCEMQLRVKNMTDIELISAASQLESADIRGLYAERVTMAEYANAVDSQMHIRGLYILDDYMPNEVLPFISY